MSSSDPIVFAARVSGMSSDDIYAAIVGIDRHSDELNDFEQAVLDEAKLRGLSGLPASDCS